MKTRCAVDDRLTCDIRVDIFYNFRDEATGMLLDRKLMAGHRTRVSCLDSSSAVVLVRNLSASRRRFTDIDQDVAHF